MNYLQLQFETQHKGDADMLTALLWQAGFEGFGETESSLLAFIQEADFEKEKLEGILKIVPVNYHITVIPPQNWNAQWESSFEPIVINDFVAIRAGFHAPVPGVKHEIIITPKMSFGTGHHATTYMMIEQMEALDFAGKSVVDFGTGTAVLAILAEKMGAASVDAIDYDEWSIENSIENAASNNCSKINLIKDETISAGSTYDIILANINLNVIHSNLKAIRSAGKNGCYILLSGFVKADEAIMLKNLSETGIYPLKTMQKGEWISILAEIK